MAGALGLREEVVHAGEGKQRQAVVVVELRWGDGVQGMRVVGAEVGLGLLVSAVGAEIVYKLELGQKKQRLIPALVLLILGRVVRVM